MKVKMLQSQEGPEISRSKEEIVSVPAKEGKRMINAGLAEPYSGTAKETRVVKAAVKRRASRK